MRWAESQVPARRFQDIRRRRCLDPPVGSDRSVLSANNGNRCCDKRVFTHPSSIGRHPHGQPVLQQFRHPVQQVVEILRMAQPHAVHGQSPSHAEHRHHLPPRGVTAQQLVSDRSQQPAGARLRAHPRLPGDVEVEAGVGPLQFSASTRQAREHFSDGGAAAPRDRADGATHTSQSQFTVEQTGAFQAAADVEGAQGAAHRHYFLGRPPPADGGGELAGDGVADVAEAPLSRGGSGRVGGDGQGGGKAELAARWRHTAGAGALHGPVDADHASSALQQETIKRVFINFSSLLYLTIFKRDELSGVITMFLWFIYREGMERIVRNSGGESGCVKWSRRNLCDLNGEAYRKNNCSNVLAVVT